MSEITNSLKMMSSRDWLVFGVDHVAYLRPVTTDEGEHAFAVHAADGTELTVVPDREIGFAAILQHEMQPASVH